MNWKETKYKIHRTEKHMTQPLFWRWPLENKAHMKTELKRTVSRHPHQLVPLWQLKPHFGHQENNNSNIDGSMRVTWSERVTLVGLSCQFLDGIFQRLSFVAEPDAYDSPVVVQLASEFGHLSTLNNVYTAYYIILQLLVWKRWGMASCAPIRHVSLGGMQCLHSIGSLFYSSKHVQISRSYQVSYVENSVQNNSCNLKFLCVFFEA